MNISTTNTQDRLYGLLRQAAEIGPGYHGRKRHVGQSEREALAAEFRREGESVPPYLDLEPNWIERRAKLFESGDYPDKGVTVTAKDLDRLASNFDLPVPILIEHAESPLEIGYLTSVSSEDGELFGILSLTEEANSLIERSGAKALSIGLSGDLAEIREVSLVRNPRIASAQLYHAPVEPTEFDSDFGIDWRGRYEHERRRNRMEKVEDQVRQWVDKGRLTPAQVPFATALLAEESGVEFDGGLVPIKDLVAKLVAAQPGHAMFGELAPQSVEDASSLLMLPEEAAFYRKHFPEVSLESIAQKRNGQAAR
jgi:hypothetical protein